MRMTNPLELFSFLAGLTPEEGPEDIRVFEGDEFLFASFDGGREQIVHAKALKGAKLGRFWQEIEGRFGIPMAE